MEAMRCHRKNAIAATGDMTRIKVLGGEWRRDLAATVRTALAVASPVIYNITGGASGGGGGGGGGGEGGDGDESEEKDGGTPSM